MANNIIPAFDLPNELLQTECFWTEIPVELILDENIPIYEIDLSSQKIINPPTSLGVTYDHNAQILYFKCLKKYNNLDLTQGACIIQYINTLEECGYYTVPYYCIQDDYIIFKWIIDGNLTKTSGRIWYNIRFYDVDLIKHNIISIEGVGNINNLLELDEKSLIYPLSRVEDQGIIVLKPLPNNGSPIFNLPKSSSLSPSSFSYQIDFTLYFQNTIKNNENGFFGIILEFLHNNSMRHNYYFGYSFELEQFIFYKIDSNDGTIDADSVTGNPFPIVISNNALNKKGEINLINNQLLKLSNKYPLQLNHEYSISFIIKFQQDESSFSIKIDNNDVLSINKNDNSAITHISSLFNTNEISYTPQLVIALDFLHLDFQIKNFDVIKNNNNPITIINNYELDNDNNSYLIHYDNGQVDTFQERENQILSLLTNYHLSSFYKNKILFLINICNLLKQEELDESDARKIYQYIHIITKDQSLFSKVYLNSLYENIEHFPKTLIDDYLKNIFLLAENSCYNLEIQPVTANILEGLALNFDSINNFQC